MKQIILASGSPRRKELIQNLPITVDVMTKEVDETIDLKQTPQYNVCALAKKKAQAISQCYTEAVVIGCDTVVANDDKILGKPKDVIEAKQMLRALSGKSHYVYTGVSIINESAHIEHTWACCSKVTMKVLTEEEINWYIETKEPMDKAGAYGIQGYASLFVQKIEGDYFNIVGLPVNQLYEKLKMLSII